MLAEKLPEAMVPSLFEFLLELPLNANGKIDRKALRALPVKAAEILNSSGRSDLPATDIELAVAQAWKEALGISEVRLNDNFFDLGAHSLTIAEVRIKLERTLGRDISIIDLFQFTTVSSLARHLSSTQQKPADSRLSDRALRRKLARQG